MVEDAKPATTKATAAAAESTASAPSGPFVQWTGASAGIASERRIRPSDWGIVGVSGIKEPTEFTLKNEFRLPESSFNEGQLDYLLNVDGHFVRVDAEGNPVDA